MKVRQSGVLTSGSVYLACLTAQSPLFLYELGEMRVKFNIDLTLLIDLQTS